MIADLVWTLLSILFIFIFTALLFATFRQNDAIGWKIVVVVAWFFWIFIYLVHSARLLDLIM